MDVATHTSLMVSGGVKRRVRRTMGCEGIVEIDAGALRNALRMLNDRGFRVGVEARDRQEAAVHKLGRARAWAAIVFRRLG